VSGPRWREISREAWRNLVSDTTHAGVWMFVLATVMGTLAWADTAQVASIVDDSAAYITGGGATWILDAPGRVDGAACAALSDATNTHGAGAVRRADAPVTAAAVPNAPLPGYEVTVGIPEVLDAWTDTGILLPDQAAETLSLESGDTLITTNGPALVGAIYAFPDDGRTPTLGYAALSLVPATGIFDQCWVRVWPSNDATVTLVYTALISGDSTVSTTQQPTLTQLNTHLASQFDAASSYSTRNTRLAGWICLGAGFATGVSSLLGRRLETAAALHSGMPHPALIWQLVQESLVWILGAAVLASVPVYMTSERAAMSTTHLVLLGETHIISGVSGAILGVLAVTMVAREKRLFALFKQR